jgi:hypothetical protein
MTYPTSRALARAAAACLALGSILFLAGGRAHPAITSGMGGTAADFFLAFAAEVRHTHNWHGMHMLILVGPLLWALGAPALLDAIRPDLRALISVGRSALLLSAALWAMAFVLDGFGAPVYASALTDATQVAVLTSFKANAIMMSRLGLVSWIAGGLGMVVFGIALLMRGQRTWWRGTVAVAGIVLGAWPLLATLQGEYAGGPFTSGYWMENALAVGLWYIALATCAFGRPAPTVDASIDTARVNVTAS